MPVARFQMPDGRVARFEVPQGTTPEQAQALIQQQISAQQPRQDAPQREHSTANNIAQGFIKGASDIGATILAPFDAAARAMGVSNSYIGRNDRRQAINNVMEEVANTDSAAFQGGKLGAYVAGTAGAPGAVAGAIRAIPGAAASLPTLLPAIESGGFSLGAAGRALPAVQQIAARAAGGAVGGAVSAGMIDPASADEGAMIGAAAPVALKAAGAAGRAIGRGAGEVASRVLGATTGVGDDAVKAAYEAGRTGNRAFIENMRGNANIEEVVGQAKQALTQMRIERGAAYRNGMAQVSGDKTVLDFAPIQQAVDRISQLGSFRGQVLNRNAAATVQELADQVSQWSQLAPDEFHTPEGLDALKQAIGDIRDATQFATPARRAADTVYNVVKGEITRQAPVYSKVMAEYSQASKLIGEIEKSLSLGEKASADTAVRKLQSILRNNVTTNFGNRAKLVEALRTQGGQDVVPALAGQSMNSWMPRGMAGAIEKPGILALSYFNPTALAAAPAMSPRIVGEAAHAIGTMSRGANTAAQSAQQAMLGRTNPLTLLNTLPVAYSRSSLPEVSNP